MRKKCCEHMGSVPAVEGIGNVRGNQQRVTPRSMDPGLYDVHGAFRPTRLSDPELDLGEDFTKPGRDCVKGKECRKLRENLTVGHRSRRRGSRLGEGRQKGGSEDCVKAWGDIAHNKVLKQVYQATETLRVVH